MKRLITLLKDKPRLYEIVAHSDTVAGKTFDFAVMAAIILSLLVAFAFMGLFLFVMKLQQEKQSAE